MEKNTPMVSLLDAFPECLEGKGIFSELTGMPWSQTVTADMLDMDYFGNHSGWKKCAPLVYKLLDTNNELSNADRLKLANLVKAKFLPNWTALWNSYHFEYNPIDDYDLTEEGEKTGIFEKSRDFSHTGTRDDTVTGTVTHGQTITEVGRSELDETSSLTHGETVVVDEDDTADTTVSKWGFNSTTDPVPTDTQSTQSTKDTTTTHSGTDSDVKASDLDETKTTTHGGADSSRNVLDSEDTSNDTTEDTGSDAEEYTKRLSGLRGQISRQELIMRERELWKESFFDKVYSDIDSVLASLIYKREHRVSPYAMFPFGYYSI